MISLFNTNIVNMMVTVKADRSGVLGGNRKAVSWRLVRMKPGANKLRTM